MADLCPVFKWWSENQTEKAFYGLNVRTVWYSDESGDQVYGIQMVTVLGKRREGSR